MKTPWKLYISLLLHLMFTLTKLIRMYGHFLSTFSLEADTGTHWNSKYICNDPLSSPYMRLSSQGKLLVQLSKTVIIQETELPSLLPSPLCSSFLTHCPFHASSLFCSHQCPYDVLYHCPTPLCTDTSFCSSESPSPGPVQPVNTLLCLRPSPATSACGATFQATLSV